MGYLFAVMVAVILYLICRIIKLQGDIMTQHARFIRETLRWRTLYILHDTIGAKDYIQKEETKPKTAAVE